MSKNLFRILGGTGLVCAFAVAAFAAGYPKINLAVGL